MHRTPLIQHPQPGVEGDCGFARSSQQSLEPSEDAMAQTTLNQVDERLGVDRYQLERSILDQKIRDANQLGIKNKNSSNIIDRHADINFLKFRVRATFSKIEI